MEFSVWIKIKAREILLFLGIACAAGSSLGCSTSEYTVREGVFPGSNKGLVVGRLLFFDNDWQPIDHHQWWNYAFYPVIGPPSVAFYLDGKKTDLELHESGFFLFQHELGPLPRNPKYKIVITRPFFFRWISHEIYFTKTPEPTIVKESVITVLPTVELMLYSLNVRRNNSPDERAAMLQFLRKEKSWISDKIKMED